MHPSQLLLIVLYGELLCVLRVFEVIQFNLIASRSHPTWEQDVPFGGLPEKESSATCLRP